MRIAFTSCMDATRVPQQPVWGEIKELRPKVDALLLLGDQVYMDWGDLGASHWHDYIDAHPKEALEAFEQDMHMRYEAQSRVPGFTELLASIPDGGLHITWDDHDFAWNNSVGDGPDLRGKLASPEVQAISRRLFSQFVAWAKKPKQPYGSIAASHLCAPCAPGGSFTLGTVPALMLDSRSERTERDAPSPTVIGQQDAALQQLVSHGQGLCVVASGTPLRYDYLFSDGAWASCRPGGTDYPQLEPLLVNASRPVLYLSGDVHRNAWAGRLRAAKGTRSQVAQVLASPAAITHIGPKKFPSSFGVLDVDVTHQVVTIELFEQDKGGTFHGGGAIRAEYEAHGWKNDLDSEAAASARTLVPGATVDTEPLLVLSARERRARRRPIHDIPLDHLEQLDALFSDWGRPPGGQPEVGIVQAAADHLGCDFNPGTWQAVAEAMDAAAQRAKAAGKKSLVLLIHGLGHSPSAAIDQAYGLRQAYPDCEPILFSWPSGEGGGLLANYMQLQPARAAANDQEVFQALSLVALAFARVDTGLPKVILARSMGSILLGRLVADQAPTLQGVKSIVLSAPLIATEQFSSKNASQPNYRGAPCEVFVTVNRRDQTLGAAKWGGFANALGRADLADPKVQGDLNMVAPAHYIDFTSGPVGPLHDYLIPHVNPAQQALNHALLCGATFTPAQHALKAIPGLNSGWSV